MQKRWCISFELILILVILLSHVYVATRPPNSLMNWYSSDDAFYYYKVAQNISEGKGITFDGLSSTNGFHPLWMLVCIPVFALARFSLILPLASAGNGAGDVQRRNGSVALPHLSSNCSRPRQRC